jgi:hypothetical protein
MIIVMMTINTKTRIDMIMAGIMAGIKMILIINITAGTDLTTTVLKDTRTLMMIRFLKIGEIKLW